MKALKIKNWCEENISPLAWKRIVLKIMDLAHEEGYSLGEIEQPGENMILSKKMQGMVNDVVMQLYSRRLSLVESRA